MYKNLNIPSLRRMCDQLLLFNYWMNNLKLQHKCTLIRLENKGCKFQFVNPFRKDFSCKSFPKVAMVFLLSLPYFQSLC